MRFTSIALSLLAVGFATVSAAPASSSAGLESRSPRKHHHSGRDTQLITGGKLTWYGGGQLDAPACGGPTPTSDSRVVAVKQGGPFKCGDTVHLHHGGKMVAAKVVDYCAGCDATHVDATQGTFSELADLDEGVLNDVHIRIIPN